MKILFALVVWACSILATPALSGETTKMVPLSVYFNSQGVGTIAEMGLQPQFYIIARCAGVYLAYSKIWARGGSHETPYSKLAEMFLLIATAVDMKLNPGSTKDESMSSSADKIEKMFNEYADIGNDNWTKTGHYFEGDKILANDGKFCKKLSQKK